MTPLKVSMPPKIKVRGKEEYLKKLAEFSINSHYILGVYEGRLSKFDILLKYKQKINKKWTSVRTPKHIHWAVDILIKQHMEKEATERFINFLISIWNKVEPLKNENERVALLNPEQLLVEITNEANEYPELANKGEYSVKFLILIARLLMVQEKTNYQNAFMFKRLLEQLKNQTDIFKAVSTATHNRK